LLGFKRPQSAYRDVLWGRTGEPQRFVLPSDITGKPLLRMSWTWEPVEKKLHLSGLLRSENRGSCVRRRRRGGASAKRQKPWPQACAVCPLYQGTAIAVIRSETGASGCMLMASVGEISASVGISYLPEEQPLDGDISEIKVGGVLDMPLAKLLANGKASA
jgi:hypothetical protein